MQTTDVTPEVERVFDEPNIQTPSENVSNHDYANGTPLPSDSSAKCDSDYTKKPIDRWARVVFAAAFIAFCIVGGLHYTTGIFYVSMLRQFNQSYSDTAWIGSLTSSFFLLVGPLASLFIEKYDTRKCMIAGSIIMTCGYLIASAANSLAIVLLGYGLIVSIGMGFCYTSSIIALSQYFETKLSIVSSYALCGNGVGIFSLSYVLEYTMSTEGWRMSFVTCAALSLQLSVLGSLYFKKKFLGEKKKGNLYDEEMNQRSNLREGSKKKISYGTLKEDQDITTYESGVDNNVEKENANWENIEVDHHEKIFEENHIKEKRNILQSLSNFKIKKFQCSPVFTDPKFWLINWSTMLIQGSTLSIYCIYKDFTEYNHYLGYASLGLSLIGIGDVSGRLSTGILSGFSWLNPSIFYGVSNLGTATVMLLFLIDFNYVFHFILSFIFGLLYGIQNIYLSAISSEIFGKENLATVLGQNLMWGGLGALGGAPIAGALFDGTRSYNSVMIFLAALSTLSGVLMFCVSYLEKKNKNTA